MKRAAVFLVIIALAVAVLVAFFRKDWKEPPASGYALPEEHDSKAGHGNVAAPPLAPALSTTDASARELRERLLETGRYTGRVFNAPEHTSIRLSLVSRREGRVILSDGRDYPLAKDGTFDIQPEYGEYEARVESGLLAAVEMFVLSKRKPFHHWDVLLQPVERVTGRVCTGFKAPVVGVEVLLLEHSDSGSRREASPRSRALTGADGDFSIEVPVAEPVSWDLAVMEKGWILTTATLLPSRRGPILIVCPQPANLTGKVVERGTGKSIAGFELVADSIPVTAGGRRIRTDGSGRFAFREIPQGFYRLRAGPGQRLTMKDMDVDLRRHPGAEVIVEVDAGVRVLGRVTKRNGAPLSEVAIRLYGEERLLETAVTTTEGAYELFAVPRGVVRLMPVQHGVPLASPVALALAEDVQEVVQDFIIEGYSVSGTIRDEAGIPVGKTVVSAFAGGYVQSVSDDQGYYEFADLPGPDVILSARLGVRKSAEVGPLPLGLEPIVQDLVLNRANDGVVEGRVVDGRGHPMRGVRVWGVSASDNGVRGDVVQTDAQGQFMMLLPTPDSYDLYVAPYLQTSRTTSAPRLGGHLSLAPGERRRGVLVRLDVATGFISGMVIDGEGRPVQGVRVSPMGERPGSQGVTDEAGRFHLGDLESSSYTLMATHKNYGTTHVEGVEVNSDDVVITLPNRSLLVLSVLDARTRRPVQDFEVVLLDMQSQPLAGPINVRSLQGVGEIPIDPALLRMPLFLRVTSRGYRPYETSLGPQTSGALNLEIDVEPDVSPPGS